VAQSRVRRVLWEACESAAEFRRITTVVKGSEAISGTLRLRECAVN
jgi:hypothetical protein